MERSWLLKREGGCYEQHAHFYTKKETIKCRELIDLGKYPRDKKYKLAMQRLLTEEEYLIKDRKNYLKM